MRASSRGNEWHDERGRFTSGPGAVKTVIHDEKHYEERTEQRKEEVQKVRKEAYQKPSKNFQDNKVSTIDNFAIKRMSKHVRVDRKERTEFAQKLIKEENAIVQEKFFIQTPKGGEEIHMLYSNGIIKVADPDGTWVTTLIARPYQVKRYYLATEREVPSEVVKFAVDHTVKKYYLIGLE